MYDAELHNWSRYSLSKKAVYFGNIWHDSKGRFADGQEIRTSLEESVEDGILQTMNTRYKLIGEEV